MTPATTWLIIALLFWILADVSATAHDVLRPGRLKELRAEHGLWTVIGCACLFWSVWLFWLS